MGVEKVIIIGSGPAGLTAAVYTARANLNPLCIEGEDAGGQLMITSDVENYPGFVNGIQGPELMNILREQAQRFGTKYLTANVTKLDLQSRPFRVWVADQEHQAHAIIVATGASAKFLGLPAEKRLMGRGVSTCATCDGAFFKDEDILVVGGGDSAMEEAIFLTRFAKQVYIAHRRDRLRASKIMAQRALDNPKIKVLWNVIVKDIIGEKQVEKVILQNTKDQAFSDLFCTGVFIAIGHEPNTELFKGLLDMDEKGYLKTQRGSSDTSIDGVFAAGDAQDFVYRQAITAAGTGCMAAIDAERWLEARGL